MPFRDDILRGLRLGATLLALLFAGVAAFRISREIPARAAPVEKASKPARPAPPPHDLWSGPAVPPPPPARKTAARRAAPVAKIPATERPAKTDLQPKPVSESVEDPVEKPAAPAVTPIAQFKDANSAATGTEEPAAKPEPRAKRVLKAVGRFLHIVRDEN